MCIKRKILNEYVTLDVETTGFNPEKHKIIAVAVCKIKNGNMDVRQYEPLLDIFINQTEEVKENSKGVTYGTNKKRY